MNDRLALPSLSVDSRTRWEASLRLGFVARAGATILADRSHTGPLRVQKPLYPEDASVCHAVIVHPPGGVVGGDALDIGITAGDGAHALLTTPGAGKWYRANGRSSRQDVRIDVQDKASVEWLPQETLFYREAEVEMTHEVTLAANARYIGSEVLCFGRTASGETFDSGTIKQTTRIRREGKLVWHEQGEIDGAGPGMHSPFGLGGHTVCATFIACGATLDASQMRQLREEIDVHGRSGATQLPQLVVVRHLGRSSEAARAVMVAAWRRLRPVLLGRDAVIPRLWHT
ncbi:urease accessory protein UreD [Massilia sp.]|uniref:urease accessory protein UreD n=1 Tax=Massilia sp. TaxID=1882437 RepID=UPI0028B09DAB|nr:urease accessory protein UreD [Massilia sp.]